MRGDLTRSAVLALLGVAGPLSRADIARRLAVSPATVTAVTRELMARGAVHEVEYASSRGGRPATLLGLSRSAGRAVGVKITADSVVFVEAALDGSLLHTERCDIDALAPDAPHEIVEIVEGYVARHRDGDGPLLGVGVAVPGAVDDQAEGVVDAPTIGWQRVHLGDLLRRRLTLPVLLENDVSAVSVAERIYGQGRDLSDFLVVTIGRGIGAGFIIDGSLYRGSTGGAGEFGHLPIASDGPLCQCGNHGCLEAHIGEPALLRESVASGVLAPAGTIDHLTDLADEGDDGARAVFTRAGETFGRALAGLVNVMDPEAVVVLGEGTAAWRHWRPGFVPTLHAHLLPARRGLRIEVEEWDDYSWALGAATLVLAAPYDAQGTAGGQGELVRALLGGGRPR